MSDIVMRRGEGILGQDLNRGSWVVGTIPPNLIQICKEVEGSKHAIRAKRRK